jgi:hypothetical protein
MAARILQIIGWMPSRIIFLLVIDDWLKEIFASRMESWEEGLGRLRTRSSPVMMDSEKAKLLKLICSRRREQSSKVQKRPQFWFKKKTLRKRNKVIVIYEPSARRHFSHMSALFEAQATKERMLHLRECAETSSRIEVCTIFF